MSRYEQLSVGELTTTRESIVTFGVGDKEGGTAAIKNAYKVTERGTDVVHKTVFTFNDTPLTFLDTGTGVGFKIYTFPKGRITVLGGSGSMAITTTSALASTLNASAGLFWGVGSVTQAGNITLATTEQAFVQTTAAVASATPREVSEKRGRRAPRSQRGAHRRGRRRGGTAPGIHGCSRGGRRGKKPRNCLE